MKPFTVVTADGEIVARISREERNRLLGMTEEGKAPRYGAPELPKFPNGVPDFNTRMIKVHRKNHLLYFAIVEPSVIRAELRREISQRVPVAEDNATIRRVLRTGTNGQPIRYFDHHPEHCEAFNPTMRDMQVRTFPLQVAQPTPIKRDKPGSLIVMKPRRTAPVNNPGPFIAAAA